MINTMMLTRAIFRETGSYSDMVSRPYGVTVNGENLAQLQESTQGGRFVTANTISGVANTILQPLAADRGTVPIANGWETRRLRFWLCIEHVAHSDGPSLVQYVSGYTDHVGIDMANNVNPQMQMTITEIVNIRRINRGNGQYTQHVSDASVILQSGQPQTPRTFHDPYGHPQGSFAMRPQDIFTHMAVSQFGDDITNLTNGVGYNAVMKSRAGNSTSTQYLANVINAYKNSVVEDDHVGGTDYTSRMMNAGGTVKEPLVNADYLLKSLLHDSSYKDHGWISFGELANWLPELNNNQITSWFTVRSPKDVNQIHQRGQTTEWNGGNHEDIIATILNNTVPALMMDSFMGAYSFTATNRTMDGQLDFRTLGQRSWMENTDTTQYLVALEHRIVTEVIPGISRHNAIDFSLSVNCNTTGDNTIVVSIYGRPPITYVSPSFAMAIAPPVVTNHQGDITNMSNHIEGLVNGLGYQPAPEYNQYADYAPESYL